MRRPLPFAAEEKSARSPARSIPRSVGPQSRLSAGGITRRFSAARRGWNTWVFSGERPTPSCRV
ncbi:MAG: hypothetical protein BJ554DRAFT_8364 [Olpidium bornovanus]|uniref:Uncharacterized protein n=1 Tax=Olpidium bornovanus TaxID=278681 RepID=A0A8H7ZUG3_9FUNG|nr:MAG: hypothetical protein BJ554DRAFT_8364 [Olpidium bornovanus]